MFSFFNLILIIQNLFHSEYAFKSLPGLENKFTSNPCDYIGYVLAYSLQFFHSATCISCFWLSKVQLQKSVLLNPVIHQRKPLEVPADVLASSQMIPTLTYFINFLLFWKKKKTLLSQQTSTLCGKFPRVCSSSARQMGSSVTAPVKTEMQVFDEFNMKMKFCLK